MTLTHKIAAFLAVAFPVCFYLYYLLTPDITVRYRTGNGTATAAFVAESALLLCLSTYRSGDRFDDVFMEGFEAIFAFATLASILILIWAWASFPITPA